MQRSIQWFRYSSILVAAKLAAHQAAFVAKGDRF